MAHWVGQIAIQYGEQKGSNQKWKKVLNFNRRSKRIIYELIFKTYSSISYVIMFCHPLVRIEPSSPYYMSAMAYDWMDEIGTEMGDIGKCD